MLAVIAVLFEHIPGFAGYRCELLKSPKSPLSHFVAFPSTVEANAGRLEHRCNYTSKYIHICIYVKGKLIRLSTWNECTLSNVEHSAAIQTHRALQPISISHSLHF